MAELLPSTMVHARIVRATLKTKNAVLTYVSTGNLVNNWTELQRRQSSAILHICATVTDLNKGFAEQSADNDICIK